MKLLFLFLYKFENLLTSLLNPKCSLNFVLIINFNNFEQSKLDDVCCSNFNSIKFAFLFFSGMKIIELFQ